MAEERNAVGNSNETAEIKHEIERTRVEMSETLGEIQERLRPDHLLQQARDGVKEAAAGKARSIMNSAGETAATVAYQARGAGDSLAGYVRQHPVQVALTVGAFTWWMLRSRDESRRLVRHRRHVVGRRGRDVVRRPDDAQPRRQRSRHRRRIRLDARARRSASTRRRARETVGEYASSARETAGEYAERARDRRRIRRVGPRRGPSRLEAARRAASTATTSVDDFVHENPLAVGADRARRRRGDRHGGAGAPRSRTAPWARRATAPGSAPARRRRRSRTNVTKKVEDVAENFVNENVINPLNGSSSEPMGRA